MICIKEGVQLSISADPKNIKGQVTFPYNGRLMTCLGRSNSEGSHSKDCQGRMTAVQMDAKKNFIKVLNTVSHPLTPIFDFEPVRESGESDREKILI